MKIFSQRKFMKYDLTVFGGGTSGVAAAYIAAKHGINTLLVERTDTLGGAITQGLVIPSMKVNTMGINTEFFTDLTEIADKYGARHKYIDGNEGWFNPELLKIVLDNMLKSVNCSVLFSSEPISAKYSNKDNLFSVEIEHKILSLYIETEYIVDATADGKIFKIFNCNFQNDNEKIQNPSIRFIMANIDIEKFADWLEKYDTDRNVTTIERTENQIYLSTAYTWDRAKNWAMEPIFDVAIKKNILEYEDSAYFQIFSIPNMPNSIAFNAPRIILEEGENPNDPFVYSRALRQGRERIFRLQNFCRTYLPGFEKAYISHISDTLGIRESYRVKCKHTMTKEHIISGEKPKNAALACDYPIDIHSNSNKTDKLQFTNNTYYLPIEALISEKYENLYAVGRIVSAEFEAQSALRTQMSCFSMGEAAAKDIINKNHLQFST